MKMLPVNHFPLNPKNLLAMERILLPSGIHKETSKKRSPVSNMKIHDKKVMSIAGRNPAEPVTRGIPSIPAPTVVPAINKEALIRFLIRI